MKILSGGQSDFFGLDVGTTAARVVQLKGSGPVKTLANYGQADFAGANVLSDAKADKEKVARAIHELVVKAGITTKNVAVNLPSSRVFTTVIEWDKMPMQELTQAIKYQAESLIPTPIDQSKVDWAVIGDSPADPKKLEILLSSVPNEYVEARLDVLEGIGLNVVAFEPDGIAMARSLVPAESPAPQVIIDLGSSNMDLAITIAGVPHLSRTIPIGTATLIRAVVQTLNIDQAQADQFVRKFGLGKDKLEGQIYNAIIGTIDSLMLEVDKSIKFFQGRYPNSKIEKIIVSGGAAALPELPLYIANKTGINVEIGNPWRNVNYPKERQDELMAMSNHFAVATGLAERTHV
jgi:type IV pilus assembly protein PilM